MVEATDFPPHTAQSEAPMPRWAITLREGPGHVVIAKPVEAKAPHTLIVEPPGQRESVVDPRMPAVKSSVETADLPGVWKGQSCSLDTGKVVRLMEGREGDKQRELLDDLRCQVHRAGEVHATMGNPVPDATDRERRQSRCDKIQDLRHRAPLIRDAKRDRRFSPDAQTRIGAKRIDLPCQHPRSPLPDREFDRRGSGIEGEDTAHPRRSA